jgi:hypothetical protein
VSCADRPSEADPTGGEIVKMIKLFAVAASVAVALIIAPAAMAGSTSLCRTNEEPCAAMKQYAAIHLIATNPVIETSFGFNVTCTSSLLSASLLALGSPQVGHISEMKWTGCVDSAEGGECEVITTEVGLIEFLKTAANLATAKFKKTNILVQCELVPIHCIYGGEPVLHGLSAELPAHAGLISAAGLTLAKVGGFFCPVTTKYNAKYEYLEDVYIST